MFSCAAMALLALLILIPGLADTLNITRFYHILLFFLAPLCVVGAQFIVKFVSKRKEELLVCILMLMVLVPYFLFQTNFVYEVTRGDSYSVPLSAYRMSPLRLYGAFGYMDDASVFCAQWLSRNVAIGHSEIYSDGSSLANVLTSYGMIFRPYVTELSTATTLHANSTIYLNTMNTEEKTILSQSQWNFSQLSFTFGDLDKTYDNGGGQVYYVP
jgi:uncharacterized membrane protein